ncbi:MAG: acyltransferase [Spirochaetales bacterium]|nr:acyltransferase [Spirochaetales bacterium]
MYRLLRKISGLYARVFFSLVIRPSLGKCGKRVHIGRHCSLSGTKNIELGNDVYFGDYFLCMATRAKVIVGDHVFTGPNVTIISGNHQTDIKGRLMDSISDEEKDPELDKDVVIKGDNWIAANAVILKGVTVGEGAVISAGAVVTKDVPPYSVVGGIPAKVIKMRFHELK